MTTVQSVTGPVDSGQPGTTLIHEHLRTGVPIMIQSYPAGRNGSDQLDIYEKEGVDFSPMTAPLHGAGTVGQGLGGKYFFPRIAAAPPTGGNRKVTRNKRSRNGR